MLIKLTKFRKEHYKEGSRPDMRTLKRLIDRNEFPYHTERHGGTIYVDPDRRPAQDEAVEDIVRRVLAS